MFTIFISVTFVVYSRYSKTRHKNDRKKREKRKEKKISYLKEQRSFHIEKWICVYETRTFLCETHTQLVASYHVITGIIYDIKRSTQQYICLLFFFLLHVLVILYIFCVMKKKCFGIFGLGLLGYNWYGTLGFAFFFFFVAFLMKFGKIFKIFLSFGMSQAHSTLESI